MLPHGLLIVQDDPTQRSSRRATPEFVPSQRAIRVWLLLFGLFVDIEFSDIDTLVATFFFHQFDPRFQSLQFGEASEESVRGFRLLSRIEAQRVT